MFVIWYCTEATENGLAVLKQLSSHAVLRNMN